jgi:hypothetical protein
MVSEKLVPVYFGRHLDPGPLQVEYDAYIMLPYSHCASFCDHLTKLDNYKNSYTTRAIFGKLFEPFSDGKYVEVTALVQKRLKGKIVQTDPELDDFGLLDKLVRALNKNIEEGADEGLGQPLVDIGENDQDDPEERLRKKKFVFGCDFRTVSLGLFVLLAIVSGVNDNFQYTAHQLWFRGAGGSDFVGGHWERETDSRELDGVMVHLYNLIVSPNYINTQSTRIRFGVVLAPRVVEKEVQITRSLIYNCAELIEKDVIVVSKGQSAAAKGRAKEFLCINIIAGKDATKVNTEQNRAKIVEKLNPQEKAWVNQNNTQYASLLDKINNVVDKQGAVDPLMIGVLKTMIDILDMWFILRRYSLNVGLKVMAQRMAQMVPFLGLVTERLGGDWAMSVEALSTGVSQVNELVRVNDLVHDVLVQGLSDGKTPISEKTVIDMFLINLGSFYENAMAAMIKQNPGGVIDNANQVLFELKEKHKNEKLTDSVIVTAMFSFLTVGCMTVLTGFRLAKYKVSRMLNERRADNAQFVYCTGLFHFFQSAVTMHNLLYQMDVLVVMHHKDFGNYDQLKYNTVSRDMLIYYFSSYLYYFGQRYSNTNMGKFWFIDDTKLQYAMVVLMHLQGILGHDPNDITQLTNGYTPVMLLGINSVFDYYNGVNGNIGMFIEALLRPLLLPSDITLGFGKSIYKSKIGKSTKKKMSRMIRTAILDNEGDGLE